jgi:hypothetical protein
MKVQANHWHWFTVNTYVMQLPNGIMMLTEQHDVGMTQTFIPDVSLVYVDKLMIVKSSSLSEEDKNFLDEASNKIKFLAIANQKSEIQIEKYQNEISTLKQKIKELEAQNAERSLSFTEGEQGNLSLNSNQKGSVSFFKKLLK